MIICYLFRNHKLNILSPIFFIMRYNMRVYSIIKSTLRYIFNYDNYETYLISVIDEAVTHNILFIKLFQALSSHNIGSFNTFKKYLDSNIILNHEIDNELLRMVTQKYNIELCNLSPINSGMIAMVFKGKLDNKRDVVIKLKRRNIEQRLLDGFKEFRRIYKLLYYINKYSFIKNTRLIEIIPVIESFIKNEQYIIDQCKFENEIIATRTMKQNVENEKDTPHIDNIVIPTIYNHTDDTSFILMDYLPCARDKLINNKARLYTITTFVFYNLLIFNLFHTDLHPGNIIYMDNNKAGIIDFGMHMLIAEQQKDSLLGVVKLLLNKTVNIDYVICYKQFTEPLLDTTILSREEYTKLNKIIGMLYTEMFNGTLTEHNIFRYLAETHTCHKNMFLYKLSPVAIKLMLGYTMYCSSVFSLETDYNVIRQTQEDGFNLIVS